MNLFEKPNRFFAIWIELLWCLEEVRVKGRHLCRRKIDLVLVQKRCIMCELREFPNKFECFFSLLWNWFIVHLTYVHIMYVKNFCHSGLYFIRIIIVPGVWNKNGFFCVPQGFSVALFYCFLNTEVQNAMRHHLERWQAKRTVGGGRRYTYNYTKDWSPRSRTESIRSVALN